jgi:hypothetical protein
MSASPKESRRGSPTCRFSPGKPERKEDERLDEPLERVGGRSRHPHGRKGGGDEKVEVYRFENKDFESGVNYSLAQSATRVKPEDNGRGAPPKAKYYSSKEDLKPVGTFLRIENSGSPDSPKRYFFLQNGNEIEVQDNYDWNTCFIKTDRRL